jgi:hypothetical protein
VLVGGAVFEAVGDPIKIAGGRPCSREILNCSTTPCWAETRCTNGHTLLINGVM